MMNREPVVLIHGIWVRGYIMRPLANTLSIAGYQTHIYSYPSTRYALRQQAQYLLDYLDAKGIERACFVAHSMGGLLLRHLADLSPTRVVSAVTLSTPHQGSLVASAMRRKHLGRLLGRTYLQGLDGELPPWPEAIPLGSLAGSHSLGLGRLLTRFPGTNDGTVQEAETLLAGLRAQRTLHYSHTGILYASESAREVEHFLQYHCFSPPA